MATALPNQNHRALVLIVDDEEMVLQAIRSLLHVETDYEVACFTDPNAGLAQLRQTNVDLILADYVMPGMDGIQFLTHGRELQPEATRILLTGYADKDSAIKAINEVGLFHYIEKPWDNSELLMVIRNGLERRFLVNQLREKMSELGDAHNDIKEVQKKLLKAFI